MGAEVIILANPYDYKFLKGLTHSAVGEQEMIRGRRGSSPDGGGGGLAGREQYRPNESDPDACSTLTQSEGIHFLAKVFVSLLGSFCVFC